MKRTVFDNGFRAEHDMPGQKITTEIRLLEHNIIRVSRGLSFDFAVKEQDFILPLQPGQGSVQADGETLEIVCDTLRVRMNCQ